MKRFAEWLNEKGYNQLYEFNKQARMSEFVVEQNKIRNCAKDDAWLIGDYEYTESDRKELKEWNRSKNQL